MRPGSSVRSTTPPNTRRGGSAPASIATTSSRSRVRDGWRCAWRGMAATTSPTPNSTAGWRRWSTGCPPVRIARPPSPIWPRPTCSPVEPHRRSSTPTGRSPRPAPSDRNGSRRRRSSSVGHVAATRATTSCRWCWPRSTGPRRSAITSRRRVGSTTSSTSSRSSSAGRSSSGCMPMPSRRDSLHSRPTRTPNTSLSWLRSRPTVPSSIAG